jgi:hypothetical protein
MAVVVMVAAATVAATAAAMALLARAVKTRVVVADRGNYPH